MRIIAGSLKGRKLTAPEGTDIRPTSDRTRESIFNLIMHGAYAGEQVIGQHVIDLCCGTGALGLEAISRGAARVTFVDKSKQALELARANALHCGVMPSSVFLLSDATSLPAIHIGVEPARLVLFDAPYAAAILLPSYRRLVAGGWLAEDALIIAEQSRNTEIAALDGATILDTRRYGKTQLVIYQRS